MPHFREFIDPNFLCNLDFLNDKGQYFKRIVTIKNVTKEEVHNGKGGTEIVATVHTEETKPFVLSKINMKAIIMITKKVNTDGWKGERIELYIKEGLKAFGSIFDVIRVSTSKPAPLQPKDYTAQADSLRACTTLAQLQSTYTALPADAKSELVNLKDQLKITLK